MPGVAAEGKIIAVGHYVVVVRVPSAEDDEAASVAGLDSLVKQLTGQQ